MEVQPMNEDNIKELYESIQLREEQNKKILCAIEKKYQSKKKSCSTYVVTIAASFALFFMGSMLWYMGIHLQKENDTLTKEKMVIKETEQPKIAGETEDLRAKILEHPGELIYLTSENLDGIDQALIDLNGDGKKEHLRFVLKETSSSQHYKGDLYVNDVNLKTISGRKGDLGQGIDADIYGISLGTEDIYLVTLDSKGESGVTTHFYSYTENTKKAPSKGHYVVNNVGQLDTDIRHCEIKDGIITGTVFKNFMGTDCINMQWSISSDSSQSIVPSSPNGYFTYAATYPVKLKEALPVAPDLNHPNTTIIMKPQKVQYTRISADFNMIYLEAEDGTTGWMEITHTEENPVGHVVALGQPVFEVFDGLRSAG